VTNKERADKYLREGPVGPWRSMPWGAIEFMVPQIEKLLNEAEKRGLLRAVEKAKKDHRNQRCDFHSVCQKANK